MRILFMGTPDFALESLKVLVENKYNVVGVVTNIDKPKGRGMKKISTPVKEYAVGKSIKVYQPSKVRNNPDFIEEIKQLNLDLIVVVAYGKILPQELLDIPKLGCINVHGSLLPKYRGAAPIQWAVLNGDKKTGITTMYMDAGMDTGDMILKEEVEIGDNQTTGELWDELKVVGAKLLIKTLKNIENGTAERIKQEGEYTIAPMLNKEMAKIDWENKDAKEIKNLVRGLNPIMGAYSFLNQKKIKFWKVDVINQKDLVRLFPELEDYGYRIEKVASGTVLFSSDKKGLFIKANNGIISVLEIQAENAKRMPIKDFLRGNEVFAGTVFE